MTTLRVGIAPYEHFKARTMAIARGQLRPAADDPKVWFTSIESFAKVLSDRNRALLALIAETNPTRWTSWQKGPAAPDRTSRVHCARWNDTGWSASKRARGAPKLRELFIRMCCSMYR